MDRARTRAIVDCAPMHADWREPVELLLPAAGHGERREPGIDAGHRPVVFEAAVLRSAAHDRLAAGVGVWSQSQTGRAADARDGASGNLAGTAHQPSSSPAPDLPVLAERAQDRAAEPGVVCRHYLRADDGGVSLPGGGHGLVQSLCASWELSNLLEATFCVAALECALSQGRPEIFNTDQGTQFTAEPFTALLQRAEVKISMDGRGRAMDNVMVERLWRTVKYEDIYLRDYGDGAELRSGLARYFRFYNTVRPHQRLGKQTPAQVYSG